MIIFYDEDKLNKNLKRKCKANKASDRKQIMLFSKNFSTIKTISTDLMQQGLYQFIQN